MKYENIIFLGDFNPPGIHHEKILRKLSEISSKVYVIPLFRFKVIPDNEKIEICKLAFQNIPKTEIIFSNNINLFEILDFYENKFGKENTFFAVGSDVLKHIIGLDENFRNKAFQKKFIIIPRKGIDIDLNYPTLDIEYLNSSSSLIRKKIKNNEDITGLVDPKVNEYIIKKGLLL